MCRKFTNSCYNLLFTILIFSTLTYNFCYSQVTDKKLNITSKWNEYKREVKSDPSKQMVELRSLMPNIMYDLRYASTNNFMHRLMYPANTNKTFLRSPVAHALAEVQQELNEKGLGLK